MNTLQSISISLGKAMNLPQFFYLKVPLPVILERPIQLSKLVRATDKKRASKHKEAANQHKVKTSSIIELRGALEPGLNTRFAVAGQDINLQATTWIIGELENGAIARIKGKFDQENVLQTTSVVILETCK